MVSRGEEARETHTDVEIELDMCVFFLLLAVVMWSSFYSALLLVDMIP